MTIRSAVSTLLFATFLCVCVSAQGIQPYPNAITDRSFYPKSPMPPPPANTVFPDPDLGALMVRITNENTNPRHPGGYFHNPPQDANAWSADNSKFYVAASPSGSLAFAFDPKTMTVSPLPGAGPGGALKVPLRPGPTFSFLDSDLMYGTQQTAPLTIATYRFSTGQVQALYDTTQCNTQPPLVAGPANTSTDITVTNDENRIEISAGGISVSHRPFVIVYDKNLGCRWYNTETGQVGGTWGPVGQVSTPDRFLFSHSKISGNGQYVRIGVGKKTSRFYVWDVTSLNVTSCPLHTKLHCSGYGALGYQSYINNPGVLDEMNTYLRPLGDLSQLTQLINPLPQPYYWGMEKNFAWNPGRLNENAPVCGANYDPAGGMQVKQPYDGEIFCIETDGVMSTIWRFAHGRAVWDPEYYWTQPFGNLSLDGRFFAFTSSWDNQLGIVPGTTDGQRTDVFVVNLD